MENDLKLLRYFKEVFEENDVNVIMVDPYSAPIVIFEGKEYCMVTRRLASYEDIPDEYIRAEIASVVKDEDIKEMFLYQANKYEVIMADTKEKRKMLTFRYCKKGE